MQVESAASTSASAISPPLPPLPARGRRAKLAEDALNTASNKVISILTEERMGQCFPLYKDQYPDLMRALQTMVVDKYNEALPIAWEQVVRDRNFIEKANELDRIVTEAEARKQRGDSPNNLYWKGADARFTVPNATVSKLLSATEELKQKRLALEAENAQVLLAVKKNQQEYERKEKNHQAILDDFQAAMQELEKMDHKDQEAIRRKLGSIVDVDQQLQP